VSNCLDSHQAHRLTAQKKSMPHRNPRFRSESHSRIPSRCPGHVANTTRWPNPHKHKANSQQTVATQPKAIIKLRK